MTTRCQIEFKESIYDHGEEVSTDRRTIYQHNDGYPEGEHGMMLRLAAFFHWLKDFELEYVPAQYITWVKNLDIIQTRKQVPQSDWPTVVDRCTRYGHGVCLNNHFHSDIEYFYEVEMIRTIRTDTLRNTLCIQPYSVDPPEDGPVTRKNFTPLELVVLEDHEITRRPG